MAEPTQIADQTTAVVAVVEHKGRKGFLPMETNTFDRVSMSIYLFVAISLLWMRFIEPAGPSVWFAVAISAILGFIIVRYG